MGDVALQYCTDVLRVVSDGVSEQQYRNMITNIDNAATQQRRRMQRRNSSAIVVDNSYISERVANNSPATPCKSVCAERISTWLFLVVVRG
jgi:predicted  nucleic acid-binding Zn ribbon protein